MKTLKYLLFICILISCLQQEGKIYATSEENSFINSFEEDITGDGLREYFKLQGTLLSNNSNYYRDVWLNIKSPFAKQWKISLNGGYDPHLQVIDLNHDHVVDLFYEVAKNEQQDQFHYKLYTIKNGSIQSIPLPEHNYIKGKFVNDFKVSLQINPGSKPITIDVSPMKKTYQAHELYDKDGKLIKEKKVIINQPSYIKPTLITKSKGYGLKSYQTVKGIDIDDTLGVVETLWYFKNDKWVVLKARWTT